MADEFIAHPLITITNVIWSFSRTTWQWQIDSDVHRADDFHRDATGPCRKRLCVCVKVRCSGDQANYRDKIGVHVNTRIMLMQVGHSLTLKTQPAHLASTCWFGADLYDVSADEVVAAVLLVQPMRRFLLAPLPTIISYKMVRSRFSWINRWRIWLLITRVSFIGVAIRIHHYQRINLIINPGDFASAWPYLHLKRSTRSLR